MYRNAVSYSRQYGRRLLQEGLNLVEILIETHRYHWTCPDCGPVEDCCVEVSVGDRPLGRWYDDGHHGFLTLDIDTIEYLLFDDLGLSVSLLEQVRGLRAQRRMLEPELGPGQDDVDRQILDDAMQQAGHDVVRRFRSFLPA